MLNLLQVNMFDHDSGASNCTKLPAKLGSQFGSLHQLFMWEVLAAADMPHVTDLTSYLSFSYVDHNSSDTRPRSHNWSYPVRLKSEEDGRYVVAIPSKVEGSDSTGEAVRTDCFSLAVQHFNGVMYIMIDEEAAPQLILYNNCGVVLLFGQSITSHNKGEPFKACYDDFSN